MTPHVAQMGSNNHLGGNAALPAMHHGGRAADGRRPRRKGEVNRGVIGRCSSTGNATAHTTARMAWPTQSVQKHCF